MRRLTCLALGMLVALPLAYAQAPDLNIGGAGARAMGMGGAFCAVADDATAAYFNPAGLAQLKRPEITLVGYMGSNKESWTYTDPGDADSGDTSANHWALNFGSIVVPLNPGGNNLILAGSAHMVLDLTRQWSLPGNDGSNDGYVSADERGYMNAYSGMVGYEVNKHLLVGTGVSFFDGDQDVDVSFTASPEDGGATFDLEKRTGGSSGGPQIVAGVLTKLTRQVKAGVCFRSKTTIDWKEGGEGEEDRTTEIELPMILLAGLSYRPSDSLTLAVDYHLHQWAESEFRDKETGEISSDDEETFRNSDQVHVGAEYLLSTGGYPIPLRLGFYTYPMSTASFFSAYVSGVVKDESGNEVYKAQVGKRNYYTGGVGIVMADMVFDVAMEYSPLKEEINVPGENGPATITNENTKMKVYLSAIYKF